MKINIAGAGAGKTTTMAEKIINTYKYCDKKCNIYCITFTNNATQCITSKLVDYFSLIPDNIKVSTIHSFLFNEIIKPYNYIIYKEHFDKISYIKLDDKPSLSKWKMSQLEKKGILHVKAFTEKAKWILVKKTGDTKEQKAIRNSILECFDKYCCKIFVDEAQDIDNHVTEILKALDSKGFDIELMGDPKQDLKGYGNLRKVIADYEDSIMYKEKCFRCPQNHLDISNPIVPEKEWQTSEKSFGKITILFENDIDVSILISEQKFDLKFISQQNERYKTHNSSDSDLYFNTLCHEIAEVLASISSNATDLSIKKAAYYFTEKLITEYQNTADSKKTMKVVSRLTAGNKTNYARIISALQINESSKSDKTFVNSIDSIKGQEGLNCLFVLTTDLAAYLLKKKDDDNKTKNRLYVALTRSLDKLTILITCEVEAKYGRECMLNFFKNYL